MTTIHTVPTVKPTWRDHVRIITALAAKDIVAALKNKTTLSTIIIIGLMVVFYRYYPTWLSDHDTLQVFVYAQDDSAFLPALERSPALSVYSSDSAERVMELLADTEQIEVGLVIPDTADAQLTRAQGPVEIDGYVMYWLTPAQRSEVKTVLEEELAIEFGRPVTVNFEGHDVYLSPETGFFSFTASIAFIFVPVMIGISLIPNLMLAEKKEKTIDMLLVSPATGFHITVGKGLTGLFYITLGLAVVLIFFGYLVLQWPVILLAGFIIALFMIGVGLLLGTVVDSPPQLQLVSWFFIMPLLIPVILVALEGLVPTGVLAVVRWIPTVSVTKLFQMGLTPTATLADYVADATVSLTLSLLLLAVVGWLIRQRGRA